MSHLALVLVAGLGAVIVAAWLFWRRSQMRALRWPEGASVPQFERLCRGYLRSHGWKVESPPAPGIFLPMGLTFRAERADAKVFVYCRPAGFGFGEAFLQEHYRRVLIWVPRGGSGVLVSADPISPVDQQRLKDRGLLAIHYTRLNELASLKNDAAAGQVPETKQPPAA